MSEPYVRVTGAVIGFVPLLQALFYQTLSVLTLGWELHCLDEAMPGSGMRLLVCVCVCVCVCVVCLDSGWQMFAPAAGGGRFCL